MSTRRLADDYRAGAAALSPFFESPPAALQTRAEAAAADWAPEILDALHAEHRRLGIPPREIAGPAVVTGQQPAIFIGPLYTVYKAITAILVAENLASTAGRHCTPVFWCGSEDHDFEEARTAHFLTKQHTPLTLAYTPASYRPGLPMHAVPLEDSLRDFIEEAAARTSGSEWRAPIMEALLRDLGAADSLSDWCQRCMARLFAETPLVFFSAHWHAARRRAVPILRRAIEAPLEASRLLNYAGEQLAAIGYPAQVIKGADECGFFLEHDGKRCKVVYAGGQFRVPEARAHYSEAELLQMLETTPERFSPNVVLRPVVQQYLFPTVAYVAGPGEISYWAQLRQVFAFFELPMPVVVPRLRALLTTAKLRAIRDEYGLDSEQLERPAEQLVAGALKRFPPPDALRALESELPHVQATLHRLAAAIAEADPHSGPRAQAASERAMRPLRRLEHRLLFSDRTRRDTVAQQIARLQYALAPARGPQERYYSIYSFLFEHGWELVPRLIRELRLGENGVQEIVL